MNDECWPDERAALTEIGWELAAAAEEEIEIEVPVDVLVDALQDDPLLADG